MVLHAPGSSPTQRLQGTTTSEKEATWHYRLPGRHLQLWLIARLNTFTVIHCIPSPPCMRFVNTVTNVHVTLGIWYLA